MNNKFRGNVLASIIIFVFTSLVLQTANANMQFYKAVWEGRFSDADFYIEDGGVDPNKSGLQQRIMHYGLPNPSVLNYIQKVTKNNKKAWARYLPKLCTHYFKTGDYLPKSALYFYKTVRQDGVASANAKYSSIVNCIGYYYSNTGDRKSQTKKIIDLLIKNADGIDLYRKAGRLSGTPLIFAVWNNDFALFEQLISAGVNPLLDRNAFFASFSNDKMLRYFLGKGAYLGWEMGVKGTIKESMIAQGYIDRAKKVKKLEKEYNTRKKFPSDILLKSGDTFSGQVDCSLKPRKAALVIDNITPSSITATFGYDLDEHKKGIITILGEPHPTHNHVSFSQQETISNPGTRMLSGKINGEFYQGTKVFYGRFGYGCKVTLMRQKESIDFGADDPLHIKPDEDCSAINNPFFKKDCLKRQEQASSKESNKQKDQKKSSAECDSLRGNPFFKKQWKACMDKLTK